MIGTIIRLVADRRFGFIKIDRTEYFFHKDDYNGSWVELTESNPYPQVNCVIVESNKGPRVADVTPIT